MAFTEPAGPSFREQLPSASPLDSLLRKTSSARRLKELSSGLAPSTSRLESTPDGPHRSPTSPLLHGPFQSGQYHDPLGDVHSNLASDRRVLDPRGTPNLQPPLANPYGPDPVSSGYRPSPSLVISSPEESDPPSWNETGPPKAGRVPITSSFVTNFSRPTRQIHEEEGHETPPRDTNPNSNTSTSSSNDLALMQERARSPQAVASQRMYPPAEPPVARSGPAQFVIYSTPSPRPPSPSPSSRSQSSNTHSSHTNLSTSPSVTNIANRPKSPSTSSSGHLAVNDMPSHSTTRPPQSIELLRRPPSFRKSSATSLYSSYSFYQLSNSSHSPTTSSRGSPEPTDTSETTKSSSRPQSPARTGSQAAYEYLQLGIQHHEANQLEESAVCFEKSATEDGGCGIGMLMWGLALRHGWGCRKDEASGFRWLQKAAELAVQDLENDAQDIDTSIVQNELIIAIYEVGQCFFQGWGVRKDRKMAVRYYTAAAKLGDADAQTDLAFCLANGKGCKKNRREAAKWYRAAVEQGVSDVGLAWIYKEKYS